MGVKLGRTPKLTPHQRREAIKRRDAGEATRDIARSYNVSHSTISRLSPWGALSNELPRSTKRVDQPGQSSLEPGQRPRRRVAMGRK
jgi:DNA invertase Pin-like site-specific DNA recombinase